MGVGIYVGCSNVPPASLEVRLGVPNCLGQQNEPPASLEARLGTQICLGHWNVHPASLEARLRVVNHFWALECVPYFIGSEAGGAC